VARQKGLGRAVSLASGRSGKSVQHSRLVKFRQ